MQKLEAGNSFQSPVNARLRGRGFTLLELLVVLFIIAIATAGVSLVMRDSSATALQRDAERLTVLLESGRAQSRLAGSPVVWQLQPSGGGFSFGNNSLALPTQWLDASTLARVIRGSAGVEAILLGPEPVLAPQEIELTSLSAPNIRWRVWTDGARPFMAQALASGSSDFTRAAP